MVILTGMRIMRAISFDKKKVELYDDKQEEVGFYRDALDYPFIRAHPEFDQKLHGRAHMPDNCPAEELSGGLRLESPQ